MIVMKLRKLRAVIVNSVFMNNTFLHNVFQIFMLFFILLFRIFSRGGRDNKDFAATQKLIMTNAYK